MALTKEERVQALILLVVLTAIVFTLALTVPFTRESTAMSRLDLSRYRLVASLNNIDSAPVTTPVQIENIPATHIVYFQVSFTINNLSDTDVQLFELRMGGVDPNLRTQTHLRQCRLLVSASKSRVSVAQGNASYHAEEPDPSENTFANPVSGITLPLHEPIQLTGALVKDYPYSKNWCQAGVALVVGGDVILVSSTTSSDYRGPIGGNISVVQLTSLEYFTTMSVAQIDPSCTIDEWVLFQ